VLNSQLINSHISIIGLLILIGR